MTRICYHGYPLHIEHGGRLPGGGYWTCEGGRIVEHHSAFFAQTRGGPDHESGVVVARRAARRDRRWRVLLGKGGALMDQSPRGQWNVDKVLVVGGLLCAALIGLAMLLGWV